VAGLVLSDASPLIGLSIVSGLPWLQSLFGQVWMPAEVQAEVLSGQVPRGEADLRAALAAGWLQTWTGQRANAELPSLDEGESACIRIALAHPAATLLLIDERAGRAVAAEHGIKIAGTAAVIGLARQRGLISSAKQVFGTLHDSDFRISAEVIRTVLARVGEA
jgi:predicted nucleic acid-binding protein